MSRQPGVDDEIAAAQRALRHQAQVLVLWDRRHGGGMIQAATVQVMLPGSDEPVAMSNGELAALRCLQLQGELQIVWPFGAMLGRRRNDPHAPLVPAIEAAALAMQRRAVRPGIPGA